MNKIRISNKTKMLWRDLSEISINDYGEIEQRFEHFPEGTEKIAIWNWFEEEFNVTINDLIKAI